MVAPTLASGRPQWSIEEPRLERTEEVGMRLIHAATSRTAARALDAARLRSVVEGYEPSFGTEGQWLPSELESPM